MLFFNGFDILGAKMGVTARLAPKGLGPQNSTKKLPHWMNLLGQPLSRNHVFENLGHEPPLKMYDLKISSKSKTP